MMRPRRSLFAAFVLLGMLAPQARAGAEPPAGSPPGKPSNGAGLLEPTLFATAGFFDGSAETSFLSEINASRAAVGVGPLRLDGGLTAYARAHAQTMAATANLHHSNIATLLGPWSTVGENVGVGPSVAATHRAFLASPDHYRNMADSLFTHVGIGVYVDDQSRIWTAHVFGM